MKLAKRYYGPFQILLQTNWHIHNAFHISLLKPFKGDPPTEPIHEETPLFDELEEVIQPEQIQQEDNTLRSCKVICR